MRLLQSFLSISPHEARDASLIYPWSVSKSLHAEDMRMTTNGPALLRPSLLSMGGIGRGLALPHADSEGSNPGSLLHTVHGLSHWTAQLIGGHPSRN